MASDPGDPPRPTAARSSPAPPPSRDRLWRIGFTAVVAGALCIAFAPILVRLSHIPPTATAFQRMLLALPLYLGWILAERRRRRRGNGPRPSQPRTDSRPDFAGYFASTWLPGTSPSVTSDQRHTHGQHGTHLSPWWPDVLPRENTRQFIVGLVLALGAACSCGQAWYRPATSLGMPWAYSRPASMRLPAHRRTFALP